MSSPLRAIIVGGSLAGLSRASEAIVVPNIY